MSSYLWELYSKDNKSSPKTHITGWSAGNLEEAWTEVTTQAAKWINTCLLSARSHYVHLKSEKGVTDEETLYTELEKYSPSGPMVGRWIREAGGLANIPSVVSAEDVERMEITGFTDEGKPANRDELRGYQINGEYQLVGQVEHPR